jgi:pyruvate/2-oxoglutarate dehydrogenase complex dihydrolipoamide acyltransferase (E2) component
MCVEWLKANGPKPAADARKSPPVVEAPKPEPLPQARDLFGNPVALPEEPPKPKAVAGPIARKLAAEPTIDVDQLRGFTTEDIESFKALGVEVRLHSETYGELWLVPAYTGKPRKELTPEHAATVVRWGLREQDIEAHPRARRDGDARALRIPRLARRRVREDPKT